MKTLSFLGILSCVPSALATVGPPVKIQMSADAPMAVAGRAYHGVWELRVGEASVFEDFILEGIGWTILTLDTSLQGRTVEPGVHRVPFTAIPRDPNAPLRFAVKFDGRRASRELRLGPISFSRRGKSQSAARAIQGDVKYLPAAESPQTAGGEITLRFTGRIAYTRPQFLNADDSPVWLATTDEGVDGILVQVMDDDGFVDDTNVDETIWSGYTDKDGYFDSGPVSWNDCDLVRCDDPDIYLRWECDTPIVNVQDAEDILEPDFSWNTINGGLYEDFTGNEIDFGTWKPADIDLMAPLHIHNSITRTYRFLVNQSGVSPDLPELDVLWTDPVSFRLGAGEPDSECDARSCRAPVARPGVYLA